MRSLPLNLLFVASWLFCSLAAASNEKISQYLSALEQKDYITAAQMFAYPTDISDEEKESTVNDVADTIADYHKRLGIVEQTNIDVAREGSYKNIGLSGGDEIFGMNNPPTNMVRVGTQFKKVGAGFITFMLATIDGQQEIVFIQYDYKE